MKTKPRDNQKHTRGYSAASSFPAKRLIKAGMLLIVIATVTVLIISYSSPIQAKESGTSRKQYISILINPGDSLWSIACEYADCHYSNIHEYIDEVMFINGLTSDLINAGCYLLVPHYIDGNT